MIRDDELIRLLAQGEADRIERTTSTKDTDKFSEAVTAFANDLPNHGLPGYLVVGVNDNGAPSGLEVTDQLLQNLGALRSDGNIQPLPSLNVAKFRLPGGDVAVVEVLPSDLPPVRYKGRVCIRVGPRKGVANQQDERILTEKRIAHARTFDALPCFGSSMDALVTDLFLTTYLSQAVAPEVIAENNRDLAIQLGSLRFYDLGRQCPTNAGILLFGKNPLQWLPGSYIQFLRLEGYLVNGRGSCREKSLWRPPHGPPRTGIAGRLAYRVASCGGIRNARASSGELSACGFAGAVNECRATPLIRIYPADSGLLVFGQSPDPEPGWTLWRSVSRKLPEPEQLPQPGPC